VSTSDAASVEGFEKTFTPGLGRAPVRAARGISLRVPRGTICGFLGPNGAGKSTTIKALLGLIRPDRGRLELLGSPAASGAWRGKVGYLPEHPNFYEHLSGREIVEWFARLSGVRGDRVAAEAARALERVGLGVARERRLRTYSKGMLQRAGLAMAMVGEPELLILDEPMTGLDPLGRHEVRQIILELKREGKTILYSTHILPDVEMTCDDVVIIDGGRVLAQGSLDAILATPEAETTVTVSGLDDAQVQALLAALPHERRGSAVSVKLPSADAANTFVRAALERGLKLEGLEQHRRSLEEVFVSTLRGAHGDTSPERAP
jgi:ABC-2 type transport system ATP-binding protein